MLIGFPTLQLKTEAGRWFLVDRDAPQEVKDSVARDKLFH
jgi:hypothetical protein